MKVTIADTIRVFVCQSQRSPSSFIFEAETHVFLFLDLALVSLFRQKNVGVAWTISLDMKSANLERLSITNWTFFSRCNKTLHTMPTRIILVSKWRICLNFYWHLLQLIGNWFSDTKQLVAGLCGHPNFIPVFSLSCCEFITW